MCPRSWPLFTVTTSPGYPLFCLGFFPCFCKISSVTCEYTKSAVFPILKGQRIAQEEDIIATCTPINYTWSVAFSGAVPPWPGADQFHAIPL